MITIKRFVKNNKATIGQLEYAGITFYTVEKQWRDNRPFVSCIPDGRYKMVRYNSPRYGEDTWMVSDVPGRTYILFHVANVPDNVQGCFGLGDSVYPTLEGVRNSRAAIAKFYDLTASEDEMELTITTEAI